MKYLVLLFLGFPAIAHEDCVNCDPRGSASPVHHLEEFSSRLEHWSANQEQVLRAPCKHRSFSTEEMNAELSRLSGKKDKKILGVRFRDENPELLKAFRNLTQKNQENWLERLLSGSRRKDEINLQNRFQLNPACEKVLCAVDRIWGEFLGRKILFMNLKYGYNGSELISLEASRFTESEMEDILTGLSDLPRARVPLYENRPFKKIPGFAGGETPNPGIWADSFVRLYDPWFAGSPGLRHQTLLHEVGHNLHYKLPRDKYEQWNTMSSWVKTGDNWGFDTVGACMVSRYGMTSPHEDFAETFSAYRYNARALLARCPEKYRFMRENVFAGIEYREESQCAGR